MKPELVVMAAGMGSRFGGLKQLEPVGPNGEKVMDYALYDAKRAGIERVVFVIRKEFESIFHEQVGSKFARWMDVSYAFQEMDFMLDGYPMPSERAKPWGTAHAVLAASTQVKAPFLAVNADDFYGRKAFQTLTDFLSQPPEGSMDSYAMVAFQMANTLSEHGTVARGVCEVGPDGYLKAVREHVGLERDGACVRELAADGTQHRFTGRELVSMNFWGFHPSLFAHLRERFARFLKDRGQDPKAEFFIPTVIDELIQEKRATVRVLETPDRWFGVTYREDKHYVVTRIQELIRVGEYPASLWS
jgi:NDP-sugar pyrophosphorylase family protein